MSTKPNALSKKVVAPKLPKKWVIIDPHDLWVHGITFDTEAAAKTTAAKMSAATEYNNGCRYCVAEIKYEVKNKKKTQEQEYPVEYV